MVEFKAEVPATLTLVDHSLFRIIRGALGTIKVQGQSNPAIFSSIKNGTGSASMTQMNVTSESQTTTGSATPGSSNSTVVVIENFAFNPSEITITAGTTVTWINRDTIGHTVTEGTPQSPKPANQRLFDSSHGTEGGNVITIAPGNSFSFTFTTPGQYDYYCIPHPYMTGHVTVLPSATTSAEQSSGYGDLTNFSLVVTGRDLVAFSAFALVVLVALMLVFTRGNRKEQQAGT